MPRPWASLVVAAASWIVVFGCSGGSPAGLSSEVDSGAATTSTTEAANVDPASTTIPTVSTAPAASSGGSGEAAETVRVGTSPCQGEPSYPHAEGFAPPRSSDVPLVEAALSGDLDLTRSLLEAGERAQVDAEGSSTLGVWASRSCSDGVELLIPLVDLSDAAVGFDLLMRASVAQNEQLVHLLLEAGADPNATGLEGESVLGLTGSAAITRLLLQSGADVNHSSDLGFTPLANAAYSGSPEVVDALLEAGASVTYFALNGAVSSGSGDAAIAMLDAATTDELADIREQSGGSLGGLAASNGLYDLAGRLDELGL